MLLELRKYYTKGKNHSIQTDLFSISVYEIEGFTWSWICDVIEQNDYDYLLSLVTRSKTFFCSIIMFQHDKIASEYIRITCFSQGL